MPRSTHSAPRHQLHNKQLTFCSTPARRARLCLKFYWSLELESRKTGFPFKIENGWYILRDTSIVCSADDLRALPRQPKIQINSNKDSVCSTLAWRTTLLSRLKSSVRHLSSFGIGAGCLTFWTFERISRLLKSLQTFSFCEAQTFWVNIL